MSIQILKKNNTSLFRIKYARVTFTIAVLVLASFTITNAQRKPGGDSRAVVVDERLAVLRDSPSLSAPLLKRLSRGRKVSILNTKRSSDGITFYRVAVTRRTRGWLQREAVVSASHRGDDERLLNLIHASNDFDRIVRASIFLDLFPRSTFRPVVLLLLAAAAEEAAKKLSSEAARRLDDEEMKANGAPIKSFFMNYNGLDRYKRQGIDFVFDETTKDFHYDGACWRELIRRYPKSPEAAEARRLLNLPASGL